MNLTNFRFETDADGIALATWDMPGRSMNVITARGRRGASANRRRGRRRTRPSRAASSPPARRLLGRRRSLDAREPSARNMRSCARARARRRRRAFSSSKVRGLSQLYRRLETCGKPFAAAIHGSCLGGAFELALACHFRVVADDDKTRVGLPEIKVGLFPGAGGTQRIARLMPTGDALQMMFKGDQIRPQAAKGMGLVHALAKREEVVAAAKKWIAEGGKGVAALGRPISACLRARCSRPPACRSGRPRTPSTGARRTTITPPRRPCCRPCSKACSSRWTRRSRSRAVISRISCARRKRRR